MPRLPSLAEIIRRAKRLLTPREAPPKVIGWLKAERPIKRPWWRTRRAA